MQYNACTQEEDIKIALRRDRFGTETGHGVPTHGQETGQRNRDRNGIGQYPQNKQYRVCLCHKAMMYVSAGMGHDTAMRIIAVVTWEFDVPLPSNHILTLYFDSITHGEVYRYVSL